MTNAASAAEAPDFAEAIESWRIWHVTPCEGGYSLTSVVKSTLWPAGRPLEAACLRPPPLLRRRRGPGHPAPEQRCECGIYAARLGRLGRYLAESPVGAAVGRVVGRVSLWGTVVECERGYRASHAYPLHLYVPLDVAGRRGPAAEEIADGLLAYGVPVDLLPVRCGEALRALGRAQLRRAVG